MNKVLSLRSPNGAYTYLSILPTSYNYVVVFFSYDNPEKSTYNRQSVCILCQDLTSLGDTTDTCYAHKSWRHSKWNSSVISDIWIIMAAVRKAIYKLWKSKEIQLKDEKKKALDLLATGKMWLHISQQVREILDFYVLPLSWDLVSTELEMIGYDYSRNLMYILFRLILKKNCSFWMPKGTKTHD